MIMWQIFLIIYSYMTLCRMLFFNIPGFDFATHHCCGRVFFFFRKGLIPIDFIPDGFDSRWVWFQMDLIPMGLIPDGFDSRWVWFQMSLIPDGFDSRWVWFQWVWFLIPSHTSLPKKRGNTKKKVTNARWKVRIKLCTEEAVTKRNLILDER